MKLAKIAFVVTLLSLTTAVRSEASPIPSGTCPITGPYDRQITVSGAITCAALGFVTGTPKADDVAELFGASWLEVGTLAGSNGTDDWLTALVTSGSWGSIPAAGTWEIDPALWAVYPRAVLTFHLGNGGGNPDQFFFELGSGLTSGTWSIEKFSGAGGGLSNITLWADSEPSPDAAVPEPGTLVLLASGLLGGAAVLRRRRKRTSLAGTPQ